MSVVILRTVVGRIHKTNQLLCRLFNVAKDPEERHDLSQEKPEVVENLKARAIEHFYQLQPRHVPEDNTAGDPVHWGGYYGPGWCEIYNVGE